MLGVAPTGGFGRTDVGRRHAESFPEGVIEVGYVIEATCVGDAGYPVVAGEVVSEPVPAFPAAACPRNWCPAHAAPSGSSGWTSSGERRRRPVRDRGYSRGGKQTAQSPRAEAREASCRHPGDARSPAADCRCSPRADRRRRVSAHGFPWTIRPDRTAGWRRMVQRAQGMLWMCCKTGSDFSTAAAGGLATILRTLPGKQTFIGRRLSMMVTSPDEPGSGVVRRG